MAFIQVLTTAKIVMSYLNQMYINEGKVLELDIKNIHQEIYNFNQQIFDFIEKEIIDIRKNGKSNSDIYKEINEIAQQTESLVLKLTEESERIKKESWESKELLFYLDAVKKYFDLFKKEKFKKKQPNLSISKITLIRLFDFKIKNSINPEKYEAIQTIDFLRSFKRTVFKYYTDIKIKYVDLDNDLSKHWLSRKFKKIFYKIKKNPFRMTAVLLGSTTMLTGVIIVTINNLSNVELYIKYINLPKKKFLYSTVPTWNDIDKEILNNKELAKLKLIRAPYNPKTAISDLMENKIDFVESISFPTSEQLQKAEERKIKLKVITVGFYLIAIAVNEKLNIKEITNPELKKIYKGEINNWKQINGPDLKITPYKLRDEHPNTEIFKKYVMIGEDFSPRVITVDTNTKALQNLRQKDPGGIYFGSAPEIVNQCLINTLPFHYNKQSPAISPYKENGTYNSECPRKTRKQSVEGIHEGYFLHQNIFVIYKEDDKNNSIGDFYSSWLLSEKGQELIKKAHFIPIK